MRLPVPVLFLPGRFQFGKNGGYCPGIDRSPDKVDQPLAVVNMGELETDDEPETESCDTDQRIIQNVNHTVSRLPLQFINDWNYRISV